jgi:hypothetical protein
MSSADFDTMVELVELRAAVRRLTRERDRYRAALWRLAKLGNGNKPGNSEGNEIALRALAAGDDPGSVR